ncbi:MAG TPA: ABC transporter permease [Clostridiaceae bacterium]|nr:ABC transporter permease [Clostridiaceae bacterium]
MQKLKGAVIPVAILMVWAAVSAAGLVNSYLLPPPQKVFGTFLELAGKGVFFEHLAVSLMRVLAGFFATVVFAIPLAIAVALNRKVYDYLEPALEFIRHIPPISLIPLLILWMGIGEAPKIAIIIMAAFFPVFLNTVSGIMNADEKLREVGAVFGFSRRDIFTKITLPQALPSMLVGLQLGLGYSWRSLVGAELIAASSGIGYMIIEAEQLSRTDIIMVGIFAIGILGYAVDYFFLKLTNRFIKWDREKDAYAASGYD